MKKILFIFTIILFFGAVTPALAGTLTCSYDTITTGTRNITHSGTADWKHWGDVSGTLVASNKIVGGRTISDLASVGTFTSKRYTNDTRLITWSNGTPTAASTDDPDGIYTGSGATSGEGYRFTVPADTGVRTLYLYFGGYQDNPNLTVSLSDASATDYTDTSTGSPTTSFKRNYICNYSADSGGQTLTITYVKGSASGGNVTISAVALRGPRNKFIFKPFKYIFGTSAYKYIFN